MKKLLIKYLNKLYRWYTGYNVCVVAVLDSENNVYYLTYCTYHGYGLTNNLLEAKWFYCASYALETIRQNQSLYGSNSWGIFTLADNSEEKIKDLLMMEGYA